MSTKSNGSQTFIAELLKIDLSLVVSKWIVDRVPYIFGSDNLSYIEWKHELGNKISVDPRAITLVGSSALGFSLNPNKKYRIFDDAADVDVAAISDYHFYTAWNWMRTLGAERFRLPRKAKESIDDHRTRLIYFGAVASDRILQYLPFGKQWVPVLSAMSGKNPINGREINVRIFRDFTALRSYQLDNLEKLRDISLSPSPTQNIGGGNVKLS